MTLLDVDRLESRRCRYQRMMARRQGPSRWSKSKPLHRYLVAKGRARRASMVIMQTRTSWCHQVSREIADKYGKVYLEGLNIKGMVASAKGNAENPGKNVRAKLGLNKAMPASAGGKLEQCLSYKTQVVKVPAAYTSQTCSECGYRANADVNAALNIKAFWNGASARGAAAPVLL